MIDKSKLHHYWNLWRKPSLIILTAGLLIFGTIAVFSLRQNNLTMLKLKQAVIVADEQNGDIETSLKKLRNYVNNHMNTKMRSDDVTEPPVRLVNQFNKLIEAEQARIAAAGNDTGLYKEIQARCASSSRRVTDQAQCIQEYIAAQQGQIAAFSLPPKELYTFDFASPRWSFDVAGLSLVLAGVFGAALVIRLVAGALIKRSL